VAGADLDTLQSLVDKSLLRFDGERHAMLETIREYAAERLLESGEAEEVGRRHADFFLGLAESAGLTMEAEVAERYDLVVPEQDNLRAAIDWALERDPELGLRLAVALEHFWVAQKPFEGMRTFEALLAHTNDLPGDLHARALRVYGGSTFIVGRFDEGTGLHEQSLAEYRRLGDERGIATLLERLSRWELVQGHLERARSLAEESRTLSERTEFKRGEALALSLLGEIAYAEGEHDLGLAQLERGTLLAGETGFTWFQAMGFLALAERTLEVGRREDAERWAREALVLGHGIGERQCVVYSLAILARLAAEDGDSVRAGRFWGALEREEERGPVGQWEAEREQYAAAVLARTGPAFERGLEEGRRLSLDAAVDGFGA
jgi:tetratricopeptide (TPR) repeat protein